MSCFYLVCNIAKEFYHELVGNGETVYTQFFIAEPEICIAQLSRVTQRGGESVESFITHFKRMRNRCKIHLPEIECMKIAQRGLELRNKFQGMDFRDFYELAANVTPQKYPRIFIIILLYIPGINRTKLGFFREFVKCFMIV